MTCRLLLSALLVFCPVAAAADAPRIVTLAPHLTELVYGSGAGDRLVGTVEYSDYPPEARQLPRVGDAWRVDLEQLLALKPDVVLAWTTGTPDDLVARIRGLGLRVVMIPTFEITDISEAMRRIGEIAGTLDVAAPAADQFDARFVALRKQYEGAASVSVFVQLDDQPLYTVGGRHIIDEIVTLCGGRNVFADLPQIAPVVTLESVLAIDPQVILSTDDTIVDPASQWARWTHSSAVRAGTIYALDADTMTRPAPRLLQGVEATCAVLADARKRLK